MANLTKNNQVDADFNDFFNDNWQGFDDYLVDFSDIL